MIKTLLLSIILLGFFSGCTPDIIPQTQLKDVKLPDKFTASGSATVEKQWWKVFNDKELNRLMEEALMSNLSLKVTWERISQAQATAKSSGATLYPNAQATISGPSTGIVNGLNTNIYAASLSVSYEIDLWGGIRSMAQAAVYDLQSSQENLRTAALSLSAEVSSTWFNLQSKHLDTKLLEKQIKLNEDNLALTEQKFRIGQVKASDVLQQRQLLESTQGDAILISNEIALLEHQLAILLGKTPSQLHYSKKSSFPKLTKLPQTGVPSEILMQRPDVKKAYFELLATDKRLHKAIVDQYPSFSISASYNSRVTKGSELFNNWLSILAGNLTAPLLDGGLRTAEKERLQALKSEKLHTYNEVLLKALKEVEDALTQVKHRQAYLKSLNKQIILAEASTQQIKLQYLHGDSDYISFLNAKRTHQSLQRNQINATYTLLENHIKLYRSLSTGWRMKQPKKDNK